MILKRLKRLWELSATESEPKPFYRDREVFGKEKFKPVQFIKPTNKSIIDEIIKQDD